MAQSGDRRQRADAFAREAEGGQHGMLAEFLGFLRHEKKWYLAPLILILLVLGLLIVLSATGAAPLIYTLF
jgi:hypothetical protein